MAVMAALLLLALTRPGACQLTKPAAPKSVKPRASSSLFRPGTFPAGRGAAGALALKGDGHYLSGRFQEAMTCYRKALALKPGDGDILIRIGDCCIRAGDFREAESAFARALKARPADPWARTGLADVFLEKGDTDRAERELKTVLAGNPGFSLAYTGLGDVHVDRGQYRQAEQAFQKALALKPRQDYPDTYIGLGEMYLNTKKFQEARKSFALAGDRDPFDADAYLGQARALLRLGRPADAEKCMEKCLALIPLHLEGGTLLVELQLGMGKKAQAQALLKKLLARHPRDEDLEILSEKL
jgi:tetratricopeptide (TPR) repeat protein